MRNFKTNSGCLIGLTVIYCLLIIAAVSADEISLSSRIDNTDIAFEQTTDFAIEIRWVGDITSYRFEILPLLQTDKLKVVGSSKTISSSEENSEEITTRIFKYTLEPTLSGTGVIKPVVLKYVSMPDSIPGELTTQEFKILIADPVPKEKPSEFPIWLILVISLLVITIAAFLILKGRKKSESVEPKKSPEEFLIEELQSAKKESQTDRKIFFSRLYKMTILYLESKYNLSVSGKTSEVILQNLEALEIPIDHKEKLMGYLTFSEKEKFAPTKGEPGDILRLCTEIENYFKNIDNNK